MKSVLILAELSHASPRIPAIAKFLPEFGWRATIVSGTAGATSGAYQVVATGLPDTDERIKRLLHLSPSASLQEQLGVSAETRSDPSSPVARAVAVGKAIANYPDQHRGWIRRAHGAAVRETHGTRFSALVSSSSPVSAHIAASKVARDTDLPWIADYRDLWSGNHNYPFGRIRRAIDRRRELSCMQHATGIVTCTPDWVTSLQHLHGRSDVFLVTNGYDPDLIPKGDTSASESFTLASTGPVYPGPHNATTLLEAVSRLVNDAGLIPGELRMRFVGIPDPLVQQEIVRLRLTEFVTNDGVVSRQASVQTQWSADALVMFTWANVEAAGHYPLRTFEYLATGRPILTFTKNPDAAAAALVMSSGRGHLCVDVDSTYRALAALYRRRLQPHNAVRGMRVAAPEFSYREKAREFAHVLDRLT